MADHGTVEYATATGNDYAGARAMLRAFRAFHACRHPLRGDDPVRPGDRRRHGPLAPGGGDLRHRPARRHPGPAQRRDDSELCRPS